MNIVTEILSTTRGHKTLGAKWLFEPQFSHQSWLYLDSEVAPKSPTFHTATVTSNFKKTRHMFNFLKTGIEFNNLAKSMNGMNVMLQDLIPKIERSYDHSEFTEDILVLAYIASDEVR